ncbi:MAG: phage major capsid protein [Actinobacteria bacterium]|nr:phage major capsid protein [Actinomycetota bacterium]
MSVERSDAMITRLESELEERNAFIQGTIAAAQDADRDLSDNETELIVSARSRVDAVQSQLDTLHDTRTSMTKARERAQQVQRELSRMRNEVDNGPVEYRSAGAYALDMYRSALGHRDASERLEVFHRAADHQKTGDSEGVIPDPVIGEVINFIDAARPIVGAFGPRPMPSATWHRPRVTQHASVAAQGTAGGAGDEKLELVSQKMTISRLTAEAVTYGGYVNVSRQSIDFSQPQVLDLIINDLAAQYAIETEAATAAALATTGTTAVGYGTGTPTPEVVAAALWEAAAVAYTAVRGQGRLVLAVAPDVLGTFGPLFAPVNPQNAQGSGFSAGQFGQGGMGGISGISTVMSSGLASGEAFVFSTAALEVYEQRVGSLQVVEPSVLGVQVAYAGYFTPLTIEDGGIVPLTATA